MARKFITDDSNPLAGAILRANADGVQELSVPALRANSPLTDRSQIMVDNAVLNVGLDRLTIMADILAAGLIFPLNDPLSVTTIEWEMVNKAGGAQRTMDPEARGENFMVDRTYGRLPVYLTTDDFSLGIRTLKMSQRVNQPLDVTQISQATRRVNEALEDSVIFGGGIQFDGLTAPGLLNAPNRNKYTLPLSWTNASITGDLIRTDVMAIVELLQAAKMWGPYKFYIPTRYMNKLSADYKANGNDSILKRLQEIKVGGSYLTFDGADMLPADTIVCVQMTNDVIDIVDGQRPTVIPWKSLTGFTLHWLVMAIMIPRVRSNYDSKSGVAVGALAGSPYIA